jgi:TP901 family phage tail tape measure protein
MLSKVSSGLGDFIDKNKKAEKMANMKDAIKSWMGFSSVINMARDALRNAYDHIRKLDSVMTEIAVVTDMTQSQLWDQISTYSAIAQQYGATTEGVYQVSQLYYQQGLQTAEVMELTEETLKMAKIAGIEYKDATDYMTVAIRGFKMEMADAQRVVDVYSHIAAITASDTEELAVAMSKTASSAEAVGSSFENTTAMIALMVETTR